MDNAILEQLQKEVYEELKKAIDNSNLFKLLEQYGLQGQKIIQIKAILDLNQIQFAQSTNINQEIKNNLQAMPMKEIELVTLAGCIPPGGTC